MWDPSTAGERLSEGKLKEECKDNERKGDQKEKIKENKRNTD